MLERRVARGARFLDKEEPLWYEQVNPGTLDYNDSSCVVGQVYGNAAIWAGRRYFFDPYVADGGGVLGFLRSLIFYFPGVTVGALAMIWRGFFHGRATDDQWRAAWTDAINERKAVRYCKPIRYERDESVTGRVHEYTNA